MKLYKNIIFVVFFLFSVYLFSVDKTFAAEHKLEDINIHVFINSDGSAEITEERVSQLSEGTENYIVIDNLGKSEIKDFVVTEDGKTYESINDWDIDASQTDKAFKNGIIETKDGYELSWGIGDYGDHEYVLEYTVTNFVKQLEDSQIIFWQFINNQTNIPPEHVTVKIEKETGFSEETEKIWGFGFPGQVQFQEGNIIASSDQPFTESDYVTILVKLPDGMTSTDDHLDKTFEEVKDEAFIGSDYDQDIDRNNSSFKKKTGSIKEFLIGSYEAKVRNTIIVIIAFIFIISRIFKSPLKLTKKRPKKYQPAYREEYYRQYPYRDHFIDIYYLLYMMGVSKFEELLSAFLLKWIHEERISIETADIGFLNRNEVSAVHFLNKEMKEKSLEEELFYLLLKAAKSADTLNENELGAWARRNKKEVLKWEKNVLNESLSVMKREGYVQIETNKTFFMKREDYALTEKGFDLEKRVHQYINYLYDFSLLNEQEAINVKVWDEVMIWAAALGLTDVAREQFKKLYPSYEQDSVYRAGSIYLTNSFSKRVSKGRTESSYVGGGGSASTGGGGGSFGGGSGGGTR